MSYLVNIFARKPKKIAFILYRNTFQHNLLGLGYIVSLKGEFLWYSERWSWSGGSKVLWGVLVFQMVIWYTSLP
jgi:hypothetical protein